MIEHGSRDAKVVALTFDDGPGPRTGELLDTLHRLSTRATMFVSGVAITGREALLRRVHDDGHELANHGHAHVSLRRRPLEAVRELRRANRAIEATTGRRPALFRPPYGHHDATLSLVAGAFGLRGVLWDVNPRDWECALDDAALIESEVLRYARGGSIILLHDAAADRSGDREATRAALPGIVTALRERGLEPVTVSELLARRRD